MEKLMGVQYGNIPPEFIVEKEIDVTDIEMCFIQYMLLGNLGTAPYNIPRHLLWCGELVAEACYREFEFYDNEWEYVYLTVRHLYGVGNRGGWHSDGFLSPDINYIWCNDHPTQYSITKPFNVPEECVDALGIMTNEANLGEVKSCNVNSLYRLDERVIHRVDPTWYSNLRTFVKITFSNERYNLKGNSSNPLLTTNWETYPREQSRNHPYVK
ncbi:hypothetical protein TSMG0143 [Halocynthia phage JM-2012]|uniref:hypothetical protein n=1 Tax=Halocynthia phage JM-2012 TaxID=1173297 RepID=UPI00025C696B|nr:hypothetical protein TSMG0143 [Halocynthia phage JM-2012]AFI55426.1 hypothetical protein TSMG0143 [Halocynthia phage JM-2012]